MNPPVFHTSPGFFLAVLTLTAYFTRLLTNQTPDPKKIAAQFIPVGALANAAYAIDELGYVVGPKKRLLETFGRGPAAAVGVGECRRQCEWDGGVRVVHPPAGMVRDDCVIV